jgi:hypothetical protein
MRAEKAIWTREKEELNAEIKSNVAQTLQTHKMRMGMCVRGSALAVAWLCPCPARRAARTDAGFPDPTK